MMRLGMAASWLLGVLFALALNGCPARANIIPGAFIMEFNDGFVSQPSREV